MGAQFVVAGPCLPTPHPRRYTHPTPPRRVEWRGGTQLPGVGMAGTSPAVTTAGTGYWVFGAAPGVNS